jgi:probable rRNA maturation factor
MELLGDIIISLPAARRNAELYEPGGIKKELSRLAIHGALHLLGYDHENDRDHKKMEKIQESLLEQICA